MNKKCLLLIAVLMITCTIARAQQADQKDGVLKDTRSITAISTGWADEAVTLGYIAAPTVISLLFVSALVNEWNSGMAGIPASAMILLAPPLICAGGHSVDISKELFHSRARVGWTLYALSIIPTSFALYGFTTDWGATLPLTIASGILGTASIVAMTTYAFSRAETARNMENSGATSLRLGLSPLAGGAMATLVLRF